MKAAIISVGTEILFGQITNTNAVFLSQELNAIGHDVMYHYTVGDNPKRLKDLINLAFNDCDLILTTGGLGPTQDDLTKEVVAEALGDTLVLHEKTLHDIENAFAKMNRSMTENNKKQAFLPSRSTIFENPKGTAPGFALEKNGKHIICMPGPPREMTAMFEENAKPYLEKKSDGTIYYRIIRTYDIGESAMETELLDLIDNQTDPTLATYAKEGECYLRIASKRSSKAEAVLAVNEMEEKVLDRIGDYVYSTDNEDLIDVVAKKLIEKNISISAAESITGGLFASTMINYGGISKVFDRSLVTYSNEAKIAELGVKEKTLETYGAVSEETAIEMVEGLFNKTNSDICIAITGIAGPEGGSDKKPVGLSYIGIIYQGKNLCKKLQTRNVGRQWNRNRAMLQMLHEVNKLL